jgi:hypothetical protein
MDARTLCEGARVREQRAAAGIVFGDDGAVRVD